MGNSKLAMHLKESPSNATYLSPDVQHELITLIGEEIELCTLQLRKNRYNT